VSYQATFDKSASRVLLAGGMLGTYVSTSERSANFGRFRQYPDEENCQLEMSFLDALPCLRRQVCYSP